jgi:hypothetical protein
MILESTLIGGLIGGLFRLAPEVLKLWNAKGDRDHEFRMRRLDMEAAAAESRARLREIETAGQMVVDAAGMKVFAEAVRAQGRPSGVKWIDGLSQLVRPAITFWWMALFSSVKLAGIAVFTGQGVALTDAVLAMWGPEDQAVLAGIINFWFLDRVIARR